MEIKKLDCKKESDPQRRIEKLYSMSFASHRLNPTPYVLAFFRKNVQKISIESVLAC